MTSFLSKKRDNESFAEKLETVPTNTKRNKLYAVKVFEDFVCEKYNNRTILDVIEELQEIKKTQDQETYDEALYGMLQDWINWNESRGIGNYTIKILFSNLRKYLFHVGIKTHEQDIKEYLRFGKKTREERFPLNQEIYRQIVNGLARNPRLQALFLTLGSSGMRIGEAINLKKKDLDFTKKRIKVNIPANTKTRAGRTTYISKEAENHLRPLVEKLDSEDYIFARKNQRLLDPSVRTTLNRLLDRIEFTDTYQSNHHRKITSHSFRAYFFTKAARKHGDNYAHRIVGHSGYLMQYDRLTEDEKLEMYIELEPDLVIFEQTKNELEIAKLRDKVNEIDELKKEDSDYMFIKDADTILDDDFALVDEVPRKPFSPEIIEKVLKIQRYRCAVPRCGFPHNSWKFLEKDHIKGRDDNSITNCQMLCPFHHRLKTKMENLKRNTGKKISRERHHPSKIIRKTHSSNRNTFGTSRRRNVRRH